MPMTGIEKTVILLYFMGTFVWCRMVLVLWWHGHEAQTFAQASLNSTRLLSFPLLACSGQLLARRGWRNLERRERPEEREIEERG
jgi:hypothetical protein